MPDSKVSALPAASALTGVGLFYADDTTKDVNVTATQIKTFAVGAGSVSVASGKTLTVSNILTLAGADGSTLNFGAGGTLGTAAFKNTGTSGGTVPVLNAANTFSTTQTFDTSGSSGVPLTSKPPAGTSALDITNGTITFQFFLSGGASSAQMGTATNHPFDLYTNNTITHRVRTDGLLAAVASTYGFGWGTSATSFDIRLLRDATGQLAQRNGANAQKFSVYNTFTDISNYERGAFDWTTTANTLRIRSENAGSGTNRIIAIDGFDKSGPAAVADIPSGTWALIHDTSGATVKLCYNLSGTLKTVALR
jgi:hypothetical protein